MAWEQHNLVIFRHTRIHTVDCAVQVELKNGWRTGRDNGINVMQNIYFSLSCAAATLGVVTTNFTSFQAFNPVVCYVSRFAAVPVFAAASATAALSFIFSPLFSWVSQLQPRDICA